MKVQLLCTLLCRHVTVDISNRKDNGVATGARTARRGTCWDAIRTTSCKMRVHEFRHTRHTHAVVLLHLKY